VPFPVAGVDAPEGDAAGVLADEAVPVLLLPPLPPPPQAASEITNKSANHFFICIPGTIDFEYARLRRREVYFLGLK
jgi:hypothetical protein